MLQIINKNQGCAARKFLSLKSHLSQIFKTEMRNQRCNNNLKSKEIISIKYRKLRQVSDTFREIQGGRHIFFGTLNTQNQKKESIYTSLLDEISNIRVCIAHLNKLKHIEQSVSNRKDSIEYHCIISICVTFITISCRRRLLWFRGVVD